MNSLVSISSVMAWEMTRSEYNIYRGWKLPSNEVGKDAGYLVEQQDGGDSNVEGHSGHVTWLPKGVFLRTHRMHSTLGFAEALYMLELGHTVARSGWNGAGMWIMLVEPLESGQSGAVINDEVYEVSPWIGMKTADDKFVPWLASQTDMLAKDWQVVMDDTYA